MAIAEMQRVRMAAHKSISDELVDKLQKLGCCQFIPQSHEQAEERSLIPLRARLRKVDELLGEARFITRLLDPFATQKGGGMAKALGDLPRHSMKELADLASEERFSAVSQRMRELERKLADARASMSRAAGLKAQLAPLAALPYSLDFYSKGTDHTQGMLLSLPTTQEEAFRDEAAKALGEKGEVFALPVGEKEAARVISVIYEKSAAETLQQVQAKYQAARIDVPSQLNRSAAEELALLDGEFATFQEMEREAVAEISADANEIYRKCQFCTDFWSIHKAKLESLISGDQTDQIVLLDFWIPKSCLAAFQKATVPFADLVEVAYVDPGEDEMPPTILKNPKWAHAMEALTDMYGTPTYGGIDPTTIITPFFYLFFGMCFGDAGYGLLISSLLIAILLKKRVTGTLRKFMIIIVVGNLVALVYGAMTFSWFGDSIDAFPFLKPLQGLKSLQVLDPMNDPMTLLGISLALGFFQVMVGLFIAMTENLRKGDKLSAFADQGGWIIFLCGLVLVGLSAAGTIDLPTGVSGAIAGAGALILVATQGRQKEGIFGKLFSGVLSLYNVTGYLGDVLSYSRLLALGLGSAAVGMVINLLCNLVSGSAVGVVLAVVIFVVGHLFSIAVNMLGAFVHALRLQYVEFFGKFYEASGEEFSPLSLSTQYVELTDGGER